VRPHTGCARFLVGSRRLPARPADFRSAERSSTLRASTPSPSSRRTGSRPLKPETPGSTPAGDTPRSSFIGQDTALSRQRGGFNSRWARCRPPLRSPPAGHTLGTMSIAWDHDDTALRFKREYIRERNDGTVRLRRTSPLDERSTELPSVDLLALWRWDLEALQVDEDDDDDALDTWDWIPDGMWPRPREPLTVPLAYAIVHGFDGKRVGNS
jgi:hypothetical protein